MHAHSRNRWCPEGSRQHVFSHALPNLILFVDDTDCANFLTMLEKSIRKFDAELLAFSLVVNHYHLLLRLGAVALSRVMHHFLTQYASAFNRRHKRRGYVFDGRYMNAAVEETHGEKVVIRYVLLNRVRAGIITLEELFDDPWSSLRPLLGTAELPYLSVERALLPFGSTPDSARSELIEFLAAGLQLSVDPYERMLAEAIKRAGDDEPLIIGSDGYVEREMAKYRMAVGDETRTIESVIAEVCGRRGVDVVDVKRGSRIAAICRAREEIAQIAFEDLRLNFSSIGRAVGVSGVAIAKAIERRRR